VTTVADDDTFRLLTFSIPVAGARFRVVDLGMAARLEQRIIDALFRGVEEQHVLVSRWIKGESNLADFLDRYLDWFREDLDRCSRITVEELQPAM
jgi:hypothetical protein